MIHGPGCPVCVLPIGRIDMAIRLARDAGVILCSYGDPMRVPASGGLSLLKAKAGLGRNAGDKGERRGDIRMIYSGADALAIAQQNPDRAGGLLRHRLRNHDAADSGRHQAGAGARSGNFSVLCCHVLTPSAIASILESPEVRQWGSVPLDGFIGPAHVSTIIGTRPYEFFAEEYRKPVVIAGFEPLDVMQAILMLIRQVNAVGRVVENEFSRAVTRDGNRKAQQLVAEVFELRRSFAWRGLGELPYSALRIRKEFADFDAERRFRAPLPGGGRPSGLRVWRHPARRQAAAGVPDFRQRVHAGKPDRLVHGVVGRGLCGALLVRPFCRRGGGA
jgi:hydrogenase expression/formation protein HypD